MSQAGKEYEQRLAESAAREDELRRQLKYAQLERSAATAEVEAVRDSLKESQAAVDTTRRMLEQQSEDHGKVLRVLNLELLEAQERASRSKHSQYQLQERVEQLQQQLSDLAVSHSQQEKHLTERLSSVQRAYAVLASREQHASMAEREAASEAALGVHAVAADLASCVDIYTSQRLDESGSGATSEPAAGHVGAEAASRAEVDAALAPYSTLQGVEGASACASPAPDARFAALASNAALAETHSRLKAKTVAIKATAHKTEADGSGASNSKRLGRGSSKASPGACDVPLLQKHLSELRGELASYKDAARRLEHENSLLKQPRAIVSPMVKRNLGAEGSGASRQSPSTAQQAHTAVTASSAAGADSNGGSAAGARPLLHASGLSSARGQAACDAGAGVAASDSAGMVLRTTIPKSGKTVPAFKRVEAAAGLILPCPAPPLSRLLLLPLPCCPPAAVLASGAGRLGLWPMMGLQLGLLFLPCSCAYGGLSGSGSGARSCLQDDAMQAAAAEACASAAPPSAAAGQANEIVRSPASVDGCVFAATPCACVAVHHRALGCRLHTHACVDGCDNASRHAGRGEAEGGGQEERIAASRRAGAALACRAAAGARQR